VLGGILQAIDGGDHASLTLLDLSAAFAPSTTGYCCGVSRNRMASMSPFSTGSSRTSMAALNSSAVEVNGRSPAPCCSASRRVSFWTDPVSSLHGGSTDRETRPASSSLHG
jgi:hypothetical protein